MILESYVCANCSTQDYFKDLKAVYRCGDAYVCSKKCADRRLEKIMASDPLLSNSLLWDPHDNYPHDNYPHDNYPHDNYPHDNYAHETMKCADNDNISIETNKIEITNINTTYLSNATNDIANAHEKENKYVERLNDTLEKNIEYSERTYHDVEKKNDNNLYNKKIIVNKNDDNKTNIIKQRHAVFCNACYKVFGLCIASIIIFTSLLSYTH